MDMLLSTAGLSASTALAATTHATDSLAQSTVQAPSTNSSSSSSTSAMQPSAPHGCVRLPGFSRGLLEAAEGLLVQTQQEEEDLLFDEAADVDVETQQQGPAEDAFSRMCAVAASSMGMGMHSDPATPLPLPLQGQSDSTAAASSAEGHQRAATTTQPAAAAPLPRSTSGQSPRVAPVAAAAAAAAAPTSAPQQPASGASIASAPTAAGPPAAPSPSSATNNQAATAASQPATSASAAALAAPAAGATAEVATPKKPYVRRRKRPPIKEQCGFCFEYKVKQEFASKQWHGMLLPRRCKACTKFAVDAKIAAKNFRKIANIVGAAKRRREEGHERERKTADKRKLVEDIHTRSIECREAAKRQRRMDKSKGKIMAVQAGTEAKNIRLNEGANENEAEAREKEVVAMQMAEIGAAREAGRAARLSVLKSGGCEEQATSVHVAVTAVAIPVAGKKGHLPDAKEARSSIVQALIQSVSRVQASPASAAMSLLNPPAVRFVAEIIWTPTPMAIDPADNGVDVAL